MSGFSSIVGFMFSFFIIIGLFTSAFVMYQKEVINNVEINDYSNKLLDIDLNLNIKLSRPFNYSGRVGFLVHNIGKADFNFRSNNNYCFDVFINGDKYIDKNDLFISPFYDISKKYNLIKSNSDGILFLNNLNISPDSISSLKLVSCEGKVFTYNYVKGFNNWFDENWNARKNINIRNNYDSNLNEYQIELNLNSSNFDFSKADEDTIRFELPLKENLVLDLSLDNNNQIIEDYSKYGSKIYLGTDSTSESEDPNFSSNNCVINNCYSFDGDDDLMVVKNSNSLKIDNQISIFSWVKWNGNGDSLQNIFTNGAWSNALRIVNDGSSNQGKILFQLNINGTVEYLYSNFKFDNDWHFIGGVYDGKNMKIYVDGKLDSISPDYDNLIIYSSTDNVIGSESLNNYVFNGSLDELKVFDVALTNDEIVDLYHNYLGYRLLDYDIVNFDGDDYRAKIFVKIPRILKDSYTNINLYYDYIGKSIIDSKSSIEKTFSYYLPRLTGYVVSDRLADSIGLSYMSLFDSNKLIVGSNNYSLNRLDSGSISDSDLNKNDPVYMKYLTQVEGNGNTGDIIVPISYAGTKFYYRGFRSGSDTFCILAPFNDSWVEMRDAGSIVWNDTVNNSGICVDYDIGTSDNLAINSTYPILIAYHGGSNYDSFVFFPATNDDLFGIPSNSGLGGTGPDGDDLEVYRSDGSSSSYSLGSYGTASFSSSGSSGSVAGHRLVSTNGGLFGAIQQADHDGTESTVFVSKKSFSTLFGSSKSNEYITLVSNIPNANCSVYNSSYDLVLNIEDGVGSQGIFKYDFDTGNDNTFISGKWFVQCDKPVWGYYEEDSNGDETNMIGFRQMRQYVYPNPSIKIS